MICLQRSIKEFTNH